MPIRQNGLGADRSGLDLESEPVDVAGTCERYFSRLQHGTLTFYSEISSLAMGYFGKWLFELSLLHFPWDYVDFILVRHN